MLKHTGQLLIVLFCVVNRVFAALAGSSPPPASPWRGPRGDGGHSGALPIGGALVSSAQADIAGRRLVSWRATPVSPLYSPLNKLLYVFGGDDIGTVTALTADCAQAVAWRRDIPLAILATPVLTEDERVLYIGATAAAGASAVLAISAVSGADIWGRPWLPPDIAAIAALGGASLRGMQ